MGLSPGVNAMFHSSVSIYLEQLHARVDLYRFTIFGRFVLVTLFFDFCSLVVRYCHSFVRILT
jgi:hypothetical protein